MATVKIKIWLTLFIIGAIQTYYLNAEVRIVCYYTNWSVYRPGTAKFNPQNINPYLCTHLIYAFGGFTKDNTLKPFDKYQDIEKGGYAKFTGLKTYNKNLKTMIAIGGWNEGSSRFSALAASSEKRKEFVKNVVKFLRINHFDGLDLDWEYPSFRDGGKPYDKENYVHLVQELREEFEREASKTGRPKLLLTMAVPAGIEYIKKGFDVEKLNKYLDWMNILSYDYHSAFEPSVNHHAPLYPLEEDNEYNYDAELNIDHTIKYYLEAGADRQKLVLGIPTYGRSYTLFNGDATDLGAPADGPGEMGDATKEKGYLAYYEICENIKSKEDWTVVQPNPDAMGPYAYKDDQWVGYDDESIVRLKAKFVAEQDLGGIMFWSIDNDDFRGNCHGRPYPLIEAAKEALIESSSNLITSEERGSVRSRSRPSSLTTKVIESSNVRNSGGRQTISQTTLERERSRIRGDNKYTSRSQNQFDDDNNSTPLKVSTRRRVSGNRSKQNQRRQSQRRSTTTTTTTTPAPSPLTIVTPSYTTPPPPATPDSGSDFKCEDEGFFPHPADCKKYFWCLSSGPSELGIVAHQFTCPAGLYFNKAADSCDYSRNVLCNKKLKTTTSTTTSTTTALPKTASTTTPRTTTARTRAPITAATSKTTLRVTSSTTTPSAPDLYEDEEYEYYDDEDDDAPQVFDSEEDPKVIKELVALIKKVGGVHELEKQLFSSDGFGGSDKTTPPTISKTLYERVLSNSRSNNNGAQFGGSRSTTGKSKTRTQTFRNGVQISQFGSEEQEQGTNRGKPQYVTINRSRQRPIDADSEENSRLYSTKSTSDESFLQTDSNSNTQLPSYVNIARTRSQSRFNQESSSEETPNEAILRIKAQRNQNSNKFRTNSEMPEYVTIARSNTKVQDEKLVNDDILLDEEELNVKSKNRFGLTEEQFYSKDETVKNSNLPEYVSTTNFRSRTQNERTSPESSSDLNVNDEEEDSQTVYTSSVNEPSKTSKLNTETTATTKYQTLNRSRTSFTTNVQTQSQLSEDNTTETNGEHKLLLSIKDTELLNNKNKETVAITVNSPENNEEITTEEDNTGTTETVDILLKPLLNIPTLTEGTSQNVTTGSTLTYTVEKTNDESSSNADKTIPLLQQARPFSVTNKSVLDETTSLKVSENYTNSDVYTSRGTLLTPHGFVLGHNGSTNSNYNNITKIDKINLNNNDEQNLINTSNKLNITTINKTTVNETSDIKSFANRVPIVRISDNQNRLSIQSRNNSRFGTRVQETQNQSSLINNIIEIQNKTDTSNLSRTRNRLNSTSFNNGRRVVSRFRSTTLKPVTVVEKDSSQITRNIRNRGRARITSTTVQYDEDDREDVNSSVERKFRPKYTFKDLSSLTAGDFNGRGQINSNNRFRINRRRPVASTFSTSTLTTPTIRTSSFGGRRQFSSGDKSVTTTTTTTTEVIENTNNASRSYVLKPRGNRIIANPIQYNTKFDDNNNITSTRVETQNTINQELSIDSKSNVSKTNITSEQEIEDINEQIHLSESNIRETDSIGRDINQIVKPLEVVRRRKVIRKQRPITSTLDFTTETNELVLVDNVDTKVTHQRDGVTEPNVIVRTRKIIRKLRPVTNNSEYNLTTITVTNVNNKQIINNTNSEVRNSTRLFNTNTTNSQRSQSRFNSQRRPTYRPTQNNTNEGFISTQTSRRRYQSNNSNRIVTRPTLELLKTSSTQSLLTKESNDNIDNESEQTTNNTSISITDANVESNKTNASSTIIYDEYENQRPTTTELLDEEATTDFTDSIDLFTEAATTTTEDNYIPTTISDNEDITTITSTDIAINNSLLINNSNEEEKITIKQNKYTANQTQTLNPGRNLFRRPNDRPPNRSIYNNNYNRKVTNNVKETVVSNLESTNKSNGFRRRYSTTARPTTSYQNRRRTVVRQFTPKPSILLRNNGNTRLSTTTYKQQNKNQVNVDETEEYNLNSTTENNIEATINLSTSNINDNRSVLETYSQNTETKQKQLNSDNLINTRTDELEETSTSYFNNENAIQEENVVQELENELSSKNYTSNKQNDSSKVQTETSELINSNQFLLTGNVNTELSEKRINITTLFNENQNEFEQRNEQQSEILIQAEQSSKTNDYEEETESTTSYNIGSQDEQTTYETDSRYEQTTYKIDNLNEQITYNTDDQNEQTTYNTGSQSEQTSYNSSSQNEQTTDNTGSQNEQTINNNSSQNKQTSNDTDSRSEQTTNTDSLNAQTRYNTGSLNGQTRYITGSLNKQIRYNTGSLNKQAVYNTDSRNKQTTFTTNNRSEQTIYSTGSQNEQTTDNTGSQNEQTIHNNSSQNEQTEYDTDRRNAQTRYNTGSLNKQTRYNTGSLNKQTVYNTDSRNKQTTFTTNNRSEQTIYTTGSQNEQATDNTGSQNEQTINNNSSQNEQKINNNSSQNEQTINNNSSQNEQTEYDTDRRNAQTRYNTGSLNKQTRYNTGSLNKQAVYNTDNRNKQTSFTTNNRSEQTIYTTGSQNEQATDNTGSQNEQTINNNRSRNEQTINNNSSQNEQTEYDTDRRNAQTRYNTGSLNKQTRYNTGSLNKQTVYNTDNRNKQTGSRNEQTTYTRNQNGQTTYNTGNRNKENTYNFGNRNIQAAYNINSNKNTNADGEISITELTNYEIENRINKTSIDENIPQTEYIENGLLKLFNQSTRNKNSQQSSSKNHATEFHTETSETIQITPSSSHSIQINENSNNINEQSSILIGSSKFNTSRSSSSSTSSESMETSTNFIHHIFAETTTDTNIDDTTKNDLIEDDMILKKKSQQKLIEVNRVVEVNYKEDDENKTTKTGAMLDMPEIDKIGEINRVTVIKIVDGNITEQTGDETLLLSEASALRNFLNSTQPVTITTKIRTGVNTTTTHNENSTINDLLTAHLHAIENALGSDDKTGRKIRIDSHSKIANTYTLQPDFTEITTLALEALFQKEKSQLNDRTISSSISHENQTPLPTLKQLVTDNEPVESQKLLNIKVLKQDLDDSRSLKFSDDSNILPIRILNDRELENRNEKSIQTNESNVVYLLKNSPFIDTNVPYSVVEDNSKRENRSPQKINVKSDKMGGFLTTNNPKVSDV